MKFTAVQQKTGLSEVCVSGLITLADTSVVEKAFASSFKIEDYPVEGSSIFFRNVDIRLLSLHSTSVQQTMI